MKTKYDLLNLLINYINKNCNIKTLQYSYYLININLISYNSFESMKKVIPINIVSSSSEDKPRQDESQSKIRLDQSDLVNLTEELAPSVVYGTIVKEFDRYFMLNAKDILDPGILTDELLGDCINSNGAWNLSAYIISCILDIEFIVEQIFYYSNKDIIIESKPKQKESIRQKLMVKCKQPVKFHKDAIEFRSGDSLTSQAKRTRDFNEYLLNILADKNIELEFCWMIMMLWIKSVNGVHWLRKFKLDWHVKIKWNSDDGSTALDKIINSINLGIFTTGMKIAPLFRFISSIAVKIYDDYTLEIVGPKFSGIIVSVSNVLPSNKADLYLWANRLLLDQ